VLTDAGRAAFAMHSRITDEAGFHLADGTGLALQLGHRRSVDFDWFRGGEFFDPLALADRLRGGGLVLDVISTDRGELHARVGGVRVSWLSYRYPLLEPLVECRDMHCRLASWLDIGAMKLSAITQRGSRKDFLDVVALLDHGVGLPTLLAAYRRKFTVEDVGHVLRALVWFDGAEREPDSILVSHTTWPDVRTKIVAAVRQRAR